MLSPKYRVFKAITCMARFYFIVLRCVSGDDDARRDNNSTHCLCYILEFSFRFFLYVKWSGSQGNINADEYKEMWWRENRKDKFTIYKNYKDFVNLCHYEQNGKIRTICKNINKLVKMYRVESIQYIFIYIYFC